MTETSLTEPLLAQGEESRPIGSSPSPDHSTDDSDSDAPQGRRITHIGELDLGDIDRSSSPSPADRPLDSSCASMESNYEDTTQESNMLANKLIHQDPSYEPLLVKNGQQLEYEPEEYESIQGYLNKLSSGNPTHEYSMKDRDSALGVDEGLVTKCNEPVFVTCPYCDTAAETTTVNVFGTCTFIWMVILFIICFPLCWLPLLWKECHDTKHFCTYCGRELGRANSKCCGRAKNVEKEIEDQAKDVGQVIERKVE